MKKNIFAEHAKQKQFVPGPGSYVQHVDWNKERPKSLHGKFRPGENINCFLRHTNAVKGQPAPNKYDLTHYWDKYQRKIKGFTSKEGLYGFYDDAVERSKDRPPVTKYSTIRLELTKETSSS